MTFERIPTLYFSLAAFRPAQHLTENHLRRVYLENENVRQRSAWVSFDIMPLVVPLQ